MKSPQLGSINSGTLRQEDLFPALLTTLRSCGPLSDDHKDFISYLDKELKDPSFFGSEQASYDLELLSDILNEFAPSGAYFGTPEGDGANAGFWLLPNFFGDFDGLRVRSLGEIPLEFSGEVLALLEEGMSLYKKEEGSLQLSKIWTI